MDRMDATLWAAGMGSIVLLSPEELRTLIIGELEGDVTRLECGCCVEIVLRYADHSRTVLADVQTAISWQRHKDEVNEWKSTTAPCGRFIPHTKLIPPRS